MSSMNNNTFESTQGDEGITKFWKFELKIRGAPSVILSNSLLVNFVCSIFADRPSQVVTLIRAGKDDIVIEELTLGETSNEDLLTRYASKIILENLKEIGENFSDFQFISIQLTEVGMVLASKDDFDIIKEEANNKLQGLDCPHGIKEIRFSDSSILTDRSMIIKEYFTATNEHELMNNLSNIDNSGQVTQSSPIPHQSPNPVNCQASTSSSQSSDLDLFNDLMEERGTCSKYYNSSGNTVDNSHVTSKSPTKTLELRDYQIELAQPGLEGKNCMIVAPTGSGKTYVAVKICEEHIKNTPNAKVVFLVPQVPLAKQQSDVIRSFLGDEPDFIVEVTGDCSSIVPASQYIARNTITVMTPQILLDLLSKRDQPITIENITLLIFDECHHTTKHHPYNGIMKIYLDKLLSQQSPLPQIVGMTASPGLGKAKTYEKAEENIKTLLANLDVTSAPVQVTVSAANLQFYQHEPQDKVIAVKRYSDPEFTGKIRKAIDRIHRLMGESKETYFNVLKKFVERVEEVRASPGTQGYEAWTVKLLTESKLIEDEKASRVFMAYARHLREYDTSLYLNDNVRSSDAKDYLEDKLFKDPPVNEVEGLMLAIYQQFEPNPTPGTNPMLENLYQILHNQFTLKHDSRCIIFVKTRVIAKYLLSFLKEKQDLVPLDLNPLQLTGTGAKSESFGMTKPDQSNTLELFQDGRCKVIVATSVAEEGLDIKACNLIITYNYSTNEVGQVQRKGRGRAKDSKVIILAYEDSDHVTKERTNKERVKLAHDILANLRTMPPDDLHSEIQAIQKRLKTEREMVETIQNSLKRARGGVDVVVYQLHCVGCKKFVTTSQHFRHINKQHRVVVDPEFPYRSCFKKCAPHQVGIEEFVTGKIFCGSADCRHDWGMRMLYKDFPASVLKISNFIISNDELKYRDVVKRWKGVPKNFCSLEKELEPAELGRLLPQLPEEMGEDSDDEEENSFDLNISFTDED